MATAPVLPRQPGTGCSVGQRRVFDVDYSTSVSMTNDGPVGLDFLWNIKRDTHLLKSRMSTEGTPEMKGENSPQTYVASKETAEDRYRDSHLYPGQTMEGFFADAMTDPVMKALLLEFEKRAIEFVQSGRAEEDVECPQRKTKMVAHKVAAYFGLEHDGSETAYVRWKRTPHQRIPDKKIADIPVHNNNAMHIHQKKSILPRTVPHHHQRVVPPPVPHKTLEQRQQTYALARNRIFHSNNSLQFSGRRGNNFNRSGAITTQVSATNLHGSNISNVSEKPNHKTDTVTAFVADAVATPKVNAVAVAEADSSIVCNEIEKNEVIGMPTQTIEGYIEVPNSDELHSISSTGAVDLNTDSEQDIDVASLSINISKLNPSAEPFASIPRQSGSAVPVTLRPTNLIQANGVFNLNSYPAMDLSTGAYPVGSMMPMTYCYEVMPHFQVTPTHASHILPQQNGQPAKGNLESWGFQHQQQLPMFYHTGSDVQVLFNSQQQQQQLSQQQQQQQQRSASQVPPGVSSLQPQVPVSSHNFVSVPPPVVKHPVPANLVQHPQQNAYQYQGVQYVPANQIYSYQQILPPSQYTFAGAQMMQPPALFIPSTSSANAVIPIQVPGYVPNYALNATLPSIRQHLSHVESQVTGQPLMQFPPQRHSFRGRGRGRGGKR